MRHVTWFKCTVGKYHIHLDTQTRWADTVTVVFFHMCHICWIDKLGTRELLLQIKSTFYYSAWRFACILDGPTPTPAGSFRTKISRKRLHKAWGVHSWKLRAGTWKMDTWNRRFRLKKTSFSSSGGYSSGWFAINPNDSPSFKVGLPTARWLRKKLQLLPVDFGWFNCSTEIVGEFEGW